MEKPYIKYYEDKNWLQNEYSTLQKSSREIGNDLHVSYKLIEIWLKKFNIPVRQPISYQASCCTCYRTCLERSLVPMGMMAYPQVYFIPDFFKNSQMWLQGLSLYLIRTQIIAPVNRKNTMCGQSMILLYPRICVITRKSEKF